MRSDLGDIPEMQSFGVLGAPPSPDGLGTWPSDSGLGEYMPEPHGSAQLDGRGRRPFTPSHLQAPPFSALAEDSPLAPALPSVQPSQQQAPAQPAQWPTGVGVLAVASGAAIGGFVGGAWGLAAGALMAGAARNLCRAGANWSSEDPTKRKEAAKSGTVGVVGLGIGAWLAYKAVQAKREHD